ncbi:hypothetical protein C2E25_03210 [Geothermobacter hydrogeniphilus]|uniref:Uncharacterized protein n=1 Tax=Geothermobacter hydrogeniphilus TaxID=1969733 RepID=A0A2K2HDE2_9BACT|nr:hypothetical protein C2E25_03210 [Geothermobacter hydrogeniphilus]
MDRASFLEILFRRHGQLSGGCSGDMNGKVMKTACPKLMAKRTVDAPPWIKIYQIRSALQGNRVLVGQVPAACQRPFGD